MINAVAAGIPLYSDSGHVQGRSTFCTVTGAQRAFRREGRRQWKHCTPDDKGFQDAIWTAKVSQRR